MMAGFNTFSRCWTVVLSVSNAVTIGFLPAASFAVGAKRYPRIVSLLLHTLWISVAWSSFTMIFTVGFSHILVRIFSDSPGYVKWGTLILPRASYMAWALPVPIVVNALLQSLQYGGIASLFTLLSQTIPLPAIASILFFTGKDNPERLFWAYPIQQGLVAVVAIPFAIFAIRKVFSRAEVAERVGTGLVLEDVHDATDELLKEEVDQAEL
jgi:Na+-driven multidrug efflux pump